MNAQIYTLDYLIQNTKKRWDSIKINNAYYVDHIVDDSLGVINVLMVRKICKHEFYLLSDVLETICKESGYDYINMEHQNIYAAGCKYICNAFLDAKWKPKILNLSNNKILHDIFDYPEVKKFINLDTTIWVDITGNYSISEKEHIMQIEPELLLKLIFIPEEQLDKGLWKILFRNGDYEPICEHLENAVLESHKKYYQTIHNIYGLINIK
jgi:hypothetical protein